MVQYLVRLAAVLVTLAAGWRTAAAECAPNWIGTPSGAAIPPTGALYVFDHDLGSGRVPAWTVSGDGRVEWSVTIVGPNVARIDYATEGRFLEVTAQSPTGMSARAGTPAHARYPVRVDWRADRMMRPAVSFFKHDAGTIWDACSFDLLALEIPQPAAAFRVHWRHGNHDIVRIVPARPRRMLDNRDAMVLELGQIDTGIATIEPQQLYAGGALALTAIFLDGSELPVTGAPEWIHMRPEDRAVRAITPPLAPASFGVAATEDGYDYPWPRWTGALIALLALGFSYAERRRRRFPI